MDIEFREGLLFTALQMDVNGITKRIDKIVIDTGAAETIISPDAVEDLGIVAAGNDEINSFYGIGGRVCTTFFRNKSMRSCLVLGKSACQRLILV